MQEIHSAVVIVAYCGYIVWVCVDFRVPTKPRQQAARYAWVTGVESKTKLTRHVATQTHATSSTCTRQQCTTERIGDHAVEEARVPVRLG